MVASLTMMAGASAGYFIAANGGYATSFASAIPLVVISLFIIRRLYSQLQEEKLWKYLNAAKGISNKYA